jgi:hypothetical protein
LGAVSTALKQAVTGPMFLLIICCYLVLLSVLGGVVSKWFKVSGWQRLSSTSRVILLVVSFVIALIAGIVTVQLLPDHYAL